MREKARHRLHESPVGMHPSRNLGHDFSRIPVLRLESGCYHFKTDSLFSPPNFNLGCLKAERTDEQTLAAAGLGQCRKGLDLAENDRG